MRQFALLTLVSLAVTAAVASFVASRVGEILTNVGNQLNDILGSF